MKPWHDCPTCPSCSGPCGSTCPTDGAEAPRMGELRCLACGHEWAASEADLEQARRADAAWQQRLNAVERMEVKS